MSGKVVKLALVVASLSGALMIAEDVVSVLEEDSAQRAEKVSSHVVFCGQLLQGSPTLRNLLYALITPQKTTLRSKKGCKSLPPYTRYNVQCTSHSTSHLVHLASGSVSSNCIVANDQATVPVQVLVN